MNRMLLVEPAVFFILYPTRVETLVFVLNIITAVTFLANQVNIFSCHYYSPYS